MLCRYMKKASFRQQPQTKFNSQPKPPAKTVTSNNIDTVTVGEIIVT